MERLLYFLQLGVVVPVFSQSFDMQYELLTPQHIYNSENSSEESEELSRDGQYYKEDLFVTPKFHEYPAVQMLPQTKTRATKLIAKQKSVFSLKNIGLSLMAISLAAAVVMYGKGAKERLGAEIIKRLRKGKDVVEPVYKSNEVKNVIAFTNPTYGEILDESTNEMAFSFYKSAENETVENSEDSVVKELFPDTPAKEGAISDEEINDSPSSEKQFSFLRSISPDLFSDREEFFDTHDDQSDISENLGQKQNKRDNDFAYIPVPKKRMKLNHSFTSPFDSSEDEFFDSLSSFEKPENSRSTVSQTDNDSDISIEIEPYMASLENPLLSNEKSTQFGDLKEVYNFSEEEPTNLFKEDLYTAKLVHFDSLSDEEDVEDDEEDDDDDFGTYQKAKSEDEDLISFEKLEEKKNNEALPGLLNYQLYDESRLSKNQNQFHHLNFVIDTDSDDDELEALMPEDPSEESKSGILAPSMPYLRPRKVHFMLDTKKDKSVEKETQTEGASYSYRAKGSLGYEDEAAVEEGYREERATIGQDDYKIENDFQTIDNINSEEGAVGGSEDPDDFYQEGQKLKQFHYEPMSPIPPPNPHIPIVLTYHPSLSENPYLQENPQDPLYLRVPPNPYLQNNAYVKTYYDYYDDDEDDYYGSYDAEPEDNNDYEPYYNNSPNNYEYDEDPYTYGEPDFFDDRAFPDGYRFGRKHDDLY